MPFHSVWWCNDTSCDLVSDCETLHCRQPVPREDRRRAVGPSDRANHSPEGGCGRHPRWQPVRTKPQDPRCALNSLVFCTFWYVWLENKRTSSSCMTGRGRGFNENKTKLVYVRLQLPLMAGHNFFNNI